MRVLFFGTPEFSVPSLTALVGEGFDVVGVVTRTDKATGRHRSSLTASPVKLAALAEELTVLQPGKPSTQEFIEQARALEPDISVVVAYGHILKPDLLAMPRLGCVNVHASLLPKLRGAAPIERAILEGLGETGVTIMQMDAGMDTGPILHHVSTPIAADETGGELRTRLAEVGALALVEALTLLDETGITPKPQHEAEATYAPKLTRAEEKIDWALEAELVARRIRAFDPAPGAWTNCRGKAIKLFDARVSDAPPEADRSQSGKVLAAGESLRVACGTGAIEACEVQPEGKARMPVRAFVNGRGIGVGDVLA
jgi:methionyl-tRNA formyltransferase